jgi:large subunit ribosomal protein L22
MSAPVTDPFAPTTRAVLRSYRSSATKARQVLDLIRGQDVVRALEILEFCDREVAEPIAKLLSSAVANAAANEDLPNAEELVVSACWADEGPTLKRWRPRARGRATRIRKRTCHLTVEVTRLPEDRLERVRAKRSGGAAALRERRVAAARRAEARRQAALEETEEASSGVEEGAVVEADVVEVSDAEGAVAVEAVPEEDGGTLATEEPDGDDAAPRSASTEVADQVSSPDDEAGGLEDRDEDAGAAEDGERE